MTQPGSAYSLEKREEKPETRNPLHSGAACLTYFRETFVGNTEIVGTSAAMRQVFADDVEMDTTASGGGGGSGSLGNVGSCETIFSTIPGSPVYAAKSGHFTRDGKPYGLPDVDRHGNNALQGHFRFAA